MKIMIMIVICLLSTCNIKIVTVFLAHLFIAVKASFHWRFLFYCRRRYLFRKRFTYCALFLHCINTTNISI